MLYFSALFGQILYIIPFTPRTLGVIMLWLYIFKGSSKN